MVLINLVREEQQHEWKEGNCLSGAAQHGSLGSGGSQYF